MASIGDIEKQLNRITEWALVSNKKNVLKGLASVLLDRDETVSAIIDGIYRGVRISSDGAEHAGVLCRTNLRLFFVSSDSSRPLFEEILASDIRDIALDSGFASLTLRITLGAGTALFKTFADRQRVRAFMAALTAGSPVAPALRDEDTGKLIEDINRTLADLSTLSKGFQGRDTGAKPAGDSDFLFREAKTIAADLGGLGDLRGMVVDDLIILASLCGFADGGGLSDTELLFLALTAMPLDPAADKSVGDLAAAVFAGDRLSDEHRPRVMAYLDTIRARVSDPGAGLSLEGRSLRSLNAAARRDRETGSHDKDRLVTAYGRFCQCLVKADGAVSPAEEARLRDIQTILARGGEEPGTPLALKEAEPAETIEAVMEKINALVGMDNIKAEINTFVNLVRLQKERGARGLPVTGLSLHAVFYGPPGTGKTTIARHLGRVYRALGLLAKGHLIETDRAGLVAGYVGQTAINVDAVVQKALDGVLFIDEAYALIPSADGRDYGHEAVDTILKRMEDHRDRLAVIVAGYTDEMERFISANPGLKSRFTRYFYFDHYQPEELVKIFEGFCKNVRFTLDPAARERVTALLTALYDRRDRTFGNGRLARTIFEKVVERQANRLAPLSPLTDEMLCTVLAEDIPGEEVLQSSGSRWGGRA